MPNIGKIIRNKRFRFKENSPIKFELETKTGKRLTLKLINCSLTGLGAFSEESPPEAEGLDRGDIIPAAKLAWKDHVYALGRLALQSVAQLKDGEGYHFGFSTIDTKLPLDGPLSKFLDTVNERTVNPYELELNPDSFSIASFTKSTHDSADLFMKCKQYSAFFKRWEGKSRFLYKTVRNASKGNRIQLTRRRKNGRQDYLSMGSNDYLGLASHPKVCEAAEKAIKEYGFGSTGSPLTTGTSDLHEELKDLIARTFKKEAALLFNSGYAANVGAMSGMNYEQDLVVADILSHASIQDGMRMAASASRFFKHSDMEHLEKILKENRDQYAGTLLVTEGVFSMDGDVPPLDRFMEIAQKHNTKTFVDEAHSFGVVGHKGLGACHKYGVLQDADIIMGTFSKIGGGIGGFITASQEVIDWYFWIARAHVFSVSITPAAAAAMLTSTRLFLETPELVDNLQKNIRHFTKGMRDLGCPINENHESAVIPIVVGDEKKLEIMSNELMEAGIYVTPIVYPAVSRNGARFRFTMMANHTISDLDFVITVFERAMKKADFTFDRVKYKRGGLIIEKIAA